MTTTNSLPSAAAPVAHPAAARSLSITAFALGLASVLLGQTWLVPIAAIVLGAMGYRREPAGRTLAVWGIVLGSVMAFGWLVAAVVGIAMAGPLVLWSLV
jgi:hypothetical protein